LSCGQTGNHPQEDSAIFGYTPDTKIKHLRIIYIHILATYLLESVVEMRYLNVFLEEILGMKSNFFLKIPLNIKKP
jgi:hypothetical protein